ncbi:MAG: hypothetical protein K0S91_2014 [Nitrososphaeraceae archaeon]|jgi:hypothetical protein|nr:hypothetical protein [Nitrososphaeraceae archaeon]
MILLLQQVLSSQVPQFQKDGCAYFIDRIFLFSLIYKCEMKISYVLDNVKSNK